MIIDLKPLFLGETKSIPLEMTFDFSDETFGGIKPFVKPVSVSGRIYSKADVVTISANMTAVYNGSCDRCGCEIEKEYVVKTERVLVEALSSEDNDELVVVENMKLDPSEFFFSELVLNLPMKHLCKEDCLGVCQQCGADLNKGSCGCKNDDIDPRLAALQELLK